MILKVNQNGFTLMEIMVALLIFSVTAVTVIAQLEYSANTQEHLRQQTLATLYSRNQLQLYRAMPTSIPSGISETRLETPWGEWTLETNILNQNESGFTQVQLSVVNHEEQKLNQMMAYYWIPRSGGGQ